MSTRSRREERSVVRKRAYGAPRLVRYGTIVELTQANILKLGPNDGALTMVGHFKSVV
jgi:hypothetical protein